MKTPTKNPEIIMRDGKPVAVILDIDIYEQMLEQIESIEDLEYWLSAIVCDNPRLWIHGILS